MATALLLTGALWGFLYFQAQRRVSSAPTQLTEGTSRCTSAPFATDSDPGTLYNSHTEFVQPTLDWSARGDISHAMPTAFFAGNTCASLPLAQAAEKLLDGGSVSQVVWSPDGTRLLLLAQPASVLDATTGRILVSLQMSTNIGWGLPTAGRAVWTADGTQIVSSATGQLVATLTDMDTFADGLVYGLAWSPNGRYLAETSAQINIWDTSTWQQAATFGAVVTGPRRFNQILTVAWSRDGSMLASVATLLEGEGLRLEVWQLS